MHAPSWLCKKLYREYPDSRIAWAGAPPVSDELNSGSFALVQFYPLKLVGSLDNPMLFTDVWDVTTRADEHGRPIRVRSNRGPIFNRWGGTRPDWDPLFSVPVYKINFKSQDISPEEFYSGRWIDWLKRGSSKQEQYEYALSRGKTLLQRTKDLAHDKFHSILKPLMNRPSESGPMIPWKFCRDSVSEMYKKKAEREEKMLNRYTRNI